MTLADLVLSLYRALGTWQAVARVCNGKALHHSAGYYQQVATGRIRKPSAATVAGIERAAACPVPLLKRDFSNAPRFGFTVTYALGERLRSAKIARGCTWDVLLGEAVQLLEEAL